MAEREERMLGIKYESQGPGKEVKILYICKPFVKMWVLKDEKQEGGDNHCREIWAKDVDKNFYKKTDIKKK